LLQQPLFKENTKQKMLKKFQHSCMFDTCHLKKLQPGISGSATIIPGRQPTTKRQLRPGPVFIRLIGIRVAFAVQFVFFIALP
jgi:hypothetical protein